VADLTVYRSTHPDVLATRDKYKNAVIQWRQDAARLITELGFPGRQWIVGTAFGGRWLVGVTPRNSTELPPRGWRRKRFDGRAVFVPDRRTRGGKDAARRLAGCKPPAEPHHDLPGMPAEIEDYEHNRTHSPGVAEMDGAIWVTWSTTPPANQVRTDMWERVRLATYYAARERLEDTREPSHA